VTGQWFSQGTPVSSTNKTNRHNITEILLKVALNTIIPNPSSKMVVTEKKFYPQKIPEGFVNKRTSLKARRPALPLHEDPEKGQNNNSAVYMLSNEDIDLIHFKQEFLKSRKEIPFAPNFVMSIQLIWKSFVRKVHG
jgi:hypothetical protein